LLAKSFPKDEKFLLTGQLLDSARSVTANIAEGFGRFHHQENILFCRRSRGSLCETMEHLISAYDEGIKTNRRCKILIGNTRCVLKK
jgi:four helix bundle protein